MDIRRNIPSDKCKEILRGDIPFKPLFGQQRHHTLANVCIKFEEDKWSVDVGWIGNLKNQNGH